LELVLLCVVTVRIDRIRGGDAELDMVLGLLPVVVDSLQAAGGAAQGLISI